MAALDREDITRDLNPVSLWREKEEVADAALGLLSVYREIEPLASRLLAFPPAWTAAHEEVLLLLRHLAETLTERRPQARTILRAFGEPPAEPALPDLAPPGLLAEVIDRLDRLEPVAALPENERSLFPLHVAELAGAAKELVALERWLVENPDRAPYTPLFLWKLAASVEENLVRSHIFDRGHGERGLLSIIDRLIGRDEDEEAE
jgi:hypothetical protein